MLMRKVAIDVEKGDNVVITKAVGVLDMFRVEHIQVHDNGWIYFEGAGQGVALRTSDMLLIVK